MIRAAYAREETRAGVRDLATSEPQVSELAEAGKMLQAVICDWCSRQIKVFESRQLAKGFQSSIGDWTVPQ